MRIVTSALAVVLLAAGGCERQASNPPAPVEIEDVVRTTAAPIDWMTRRIAGDLVPVEMLCPAGQDPATWRPEPEVVARYQRAKLIIVNGAEFETWVLTAPLPRSRVVRTAKAIDGELLVVPGETHSHGPEGEHAHDLINGHTWLDPINTIAQAGAIADALSTAYPQHASRFAENRFALVADLRALHERLGAIDVSTVKIVAAKNPYGYIARRYGWPTIEIGGGPAEWQAGLDRMGVSAGPGAPTLVLCEEVPEDAETRTLLESYGVCAVAWDTGELADGDPYTAVLTRNIDRLESVISELAP